MRKLSLPVLVLVLIPLSGCRDVQVRDEPPPPVGGGAATCGDIDTSGTELVSNSDFDRALEDWERFEVGAAGFNNVTHDSRTTCGKAAVFTREGSEGGTGHIALLQPLEIEVDEFSRLRLQMLFRIDAQELTSDGFLGGETPVFVTTNYEDEAGILKSWIRGFLVTGSQINYPDRDQVIPPSAWFQYTEDNILPEIPDAARITRIVAGGNGQDFHSSISLVSLRGE
ncbi:MAG: hypothetical protein IBX61_07365 [Thermoleophilia bacterium]|nr:hypothetical protein [Thermoleophilia bacterium]